MRYETRQVYNRPLIICILDDGTEGAARLPANGDEGAARQTALERAKVAQRAKNTPPMSKDEMRAAKARKREAKAARRLQSEKESDT